MWVSALLPLAVGLYGLAAACVAGKRFEEGRWVASSGLVFHLAWLVWRGVAISFVPLTNKAESFSAATFAMVAVVVFAWLEERAFVLPQLVLAVGAGVAASRFPQELSEPGPLLRTWWYPAHVPLSFVALATWSAAASAALAWVTTKDRAWLNRVDFFALQGLGLWSLAMVFGGVWGVVAWGAYFLWDPKMIWSVILWLHYAVFVHVRLTPSLQGRAWVRPALAGLGIVWVFVAWVGTSFFFGKSTHAF